MDNKDQKIINLYRKTRLLAPSKLLDDKILLAAQARLSQKPPHSKRIIWALSSVAVLVLSVNVALKLVIEPDAGMTPASSSPMPQYKESDDQPEALNDLKKHQETADTIKLQRKTEIKRRLKSESMAKSKKSVLQKQRLATPQMMQAPIELLEAESSHLMDSTSNTIPTFTFNADELQALYKGLIIENPQANKIHIYNESTLVLTLNQQLNNLIQLTAYPQSEQLGLDINWLLKPEQLTQCIKNNSYLQCDINKTQTAYFINNKLIKVTWMQ